MPLSEQELDALIKKVEAGEKLTRGEELLYMTEVLKFPKRHAKKILYINEHYSEEFLID